MSPAPATTFCWSPERHVDFHACLRRYFYRYYAEAPAFRQVRDLRPRAAWAREQLLRGAHAFLREALDEEAAADRLLQFLRDDFRASRQHGYRARPKATDGLFEHEYAIAVPDDEWKDLADRTVADLRAFCRSDYARDLRTLPAADRLAVGEGLRFDLLGLPVELRPDVVVKTPAGITLHAWVGASDDAARPLARAALAWLAVSRWAAKPEGLKVAEYAFPCGPMTEHDWTAEALDGARELVHDDAYEMRYPLADPDRNLAREEDFDFTENEPICHACPFLRLCARWR